MCVLSTAVWRKFITYKGCKKLYGTHKIFRLRQAKKGKPKRARENLLSEHAQQRLMYSFPELCLKLKKLNNFTMKGNM